MTTPSVALIQTTGNVATAAYGTAPPAGFSILTNGDGDPVRESYKSGVQATAYTNASGQIWVGIAGTNDLKDVSAWAGAYVVPDRKPDSTHSAKVFVDTKNSAKHGWMAVVVRMCGARQEWP